MLATKMSASMVMLSAAYRLFFGRWGLRGTVAKIDDWKYCKVILRSPSKWWALTNLGIQKQLEYFVDNHKKILRWWLSGYLPSYIEDITNITAKHYNHDLWRTSWQ